MYIVYRHSDPNAQNYDEDSITDEFRAIRNVFWDSALSDDGDVTFGSWLQKRGVGTVTSVSEEYVKLYPDSEDYFVLELHFKSESDFLVFKLKYL